MRPYRDRPVVVIGAGPYGLSISAHLTGAGVAHRVFGRPMETWTTGMPAGMLLKSAAMASSLSDPEGSFTLQAFCAENGVAYHPYDMALPVNLFAAYGQAFQRRFVPHLEEQVVTGLTRGETGFEVTLADRTTVDASRVVIATGIRRFAHVPEVLGGLAQGQVSHSAECGDLRHLRGLEVAVLGGGSSAVDVAAALHRVGAKPTLVARRPALRFPPTNGLRRWHHGLRAPMTPLGPGWTKVMACKGPLVFHRMPAEFRAKVLGKYLGPSPTLSVRETIETEVNLVLGARVTRAESVEGRVALSLDQHGRERHVTSDHVIAATGYKVDLARLGFVDRSLLHAVATHNAYPVLSASCAARPSARNAFPSTS